MRRWSGEISASGGMAFRSVTTAAASSRIASQFASSFATHGKSRVSCTGWLRMRDEAATQPLTLGCMYLPKRMIHGFFGTSFELGGTKPGSFLQSLPLPSDAMIRDPPLPVIERRIAPGRGGRKGRSAKASAPRPEPHEIVVDERQPHHLGIIRAQPAGQALDALVEFESVSRARSSATSDSIQRKAATRSPRVTGVTRCRLDDG